MPKFSVFLYSSPKLVFVLVLLLISPPSFKTSLSAWWSATAPRPGLSLPCPPPCCAYRLTWNIPEKMGLMQSLSSNAVCTEWVNTGKAPPRVPAEGTDVLSLLVLSSWLPHSSRLDPHRPIPQLSSAQVSSPLRLFTSSEPKGHFFDDHMTTGLTRGTAGDGFFKIIYLLCCLTL